jgi:ArsR family transcriptional regulator, arsenate/arsenite/antimonite-responsive transcriptional repressor
MSPVFQALNDDTRRAILDLLRNGDLSAGEIAEHFQLGKPTVSHHLDLLKRAGLVVSEKRGQFVIYSLSTSVLEDAMRWLLTLTKKGSRSDKTRTKRHEDNTQKRVADAARARRAVPVPRRRLAADS